MNARALWLDQLTDEEAAILERRVPQQLDRRPDVLVMEPDNHRNRKPVQGFG